MPTGSIRNIYVLDGRMLANSSDPKIACSLPFLSHRSLPAAFTVIDSFRIWPVTKEKVPEMLVTICIQRIRHEKFHPMRRPAAWVLLGIAPGPHGSRMGAALSGFLGIHCCLGRTASGCAAALTDA